MHQLERSTHAAPGIPPSQPSPKRWYARCKVGQRPQRIQGVYLRIPLVLDLRHAAQLLRAALPAHRVAGHGQRGGVRSGQRPAGNGGRRKRQQVECSGSGAGVHQTVAVAPQAPEVGREACGKAGGSRSLKKQAGGPGALGLLSLCIGRAGRHHRATASSGGGPPKTRPAAGAHGSSRRCCSWVNSAGTLAGKHSGSRGPAPSGAPLNCTECAPGGSLCVPVQSGDCPAANPCPSWAAGQATEEGRGIAHRLTSFALPLQLMVSLGCWGQAQPNARTCFQPSAQRRDKAGRARACEVAPAGAIKGSRLALCRCGLPSRVVGRRPSCRAWQTRALGRRP